MAFRMKVLQNICSGVKCQRCVSIQVNLDSMSKFPLIPLETTLQRYLAEIEHIVTPEEFEETKRIVKRFAKSGGHGERLHRALRTRSNELDNWFTGWYNKRIHYAGRNPHGGIMSCSAGLYSCLLPRVSYDSKESWIERMAKMAAATGFYVREFTRGKSANLHPYMRFHTLRILGGYRIPHENQDAPLHHPVNMPDAPRHIIVMHNNHIFKVDVLRENQEVVSVNDLYQQFIEIIEKSQQPGVPVGILPAGLRKTWAQIYRKFMLDPRNQYSMKIIQSALLVICLDQPVPNGDTADEYEFFKIHNRNCFYGPNAANRWPDKPMNMISSPQGGLGAICEHSASDGDPQLRLIFQLMHLADNVISSVNLKPLPHHVLSPEKLVFNVDTELMCVMERMIEEHNGRADYYQLEFSTFDAFGSNFIRSHKLSPDSLLLVMLLWTFYRIHGYFGSVRAPFNLRNFKYGRPDTRYGVFQETVDFIYAADDPRVSTQMKAEYLRKAVNRQQTHTKAVANGEGVHLQLSGMQYLAEELSEDVDYFFKDISYQRMTKPSLMVSSVTVGANVPPVFIANIPRVPDGYGLICNMYPEKIFSYLSVHTTSSIADVKRFKAEMESCFLQTRNILESL